MDMFRALYDALFQQFFTYVHKLVYSVTDEHFSRIFS